MVAGRKRQKFKLEVIAQPGGFGEEVKYKMIQVGQRKRARYWGEFTVSKVAKLESPVMCYSEEIGDVLFNPTLVKIAWDRAPSWDKHEIWSPYWITIGGKEKYGQFAPMIGESALLELLEKAIEQDFFSNEFLSKLSAIIKKHIDRK